VRGARSVRIRRLLSGLVVLGALVPPTPARGNEVKSMHDPEVIARFKSRIGFPDSLPGDAPGRGVIVAWPDPQTFSYFKGGGWATIIDTVSVPKPGLVQHNWVLRAGRATVDLRIFVSSLGNSAARDHLVELAATTMLADIPYEPTPKRLGDLSVMTREAPPLHRLIWVERNVCMHLSRNFGTDIMPLAEELQAFLARQQSDTLAPHLPRLQSLDLSSADVTLGSTVRATLRAPRLGDLGAFVVTFSDPAQRVQLTEQEGLGATLEATNPGRTTLHAIVADRRTLLSADVTADIAVRAP
jgi:hypothetical protein